MIPILEELITNPEYYVQKAVGWTLEELYNVYPVGTIKYLCDEFIGYHILLLPQVLKNSLTKRK
ncbi:MAG TPA: hypothetical protein DDY13_11910 [Cytophagales bacterium]|nr:hypothetical protein [Cytophagales bacterium]